ncbi:hypothetical protein [Microvirga zambiensis]|uniref:hypothetical protein n=1 Tax=Microvirga zambiensis TaxID=1402137 RepID=UPI00191D3C8D|nr:hypothetical protein [Microvirga zambiensis]
MLDRVCRHGRSVQRGHFCQILREGIDLLLEEKKSGSDGTQLSFINDKGEFVHWGYVGL